MPLFKPRGGKLLTTFILHADSQTPEKEDGDVSVPRAGEGAFFFYMNQKRDPDSLQQQLSSMQRIFKLKKRPTAIDRMRLKPVKIEKETLCYYENSENGNFDEGDNGLFSCDHIFVDAPSAKNSHLSSVNDITWESFLESPLLFFDDRYNGPGFWKFVEEMLWKSTRSFEAGTVKIQLQGLAVPVAEESIETGYTYDVFYSKSERSPSDASTEARSAIKYTVRDIESLKEVLRKSEEYTTSVETDVGRCHLVLYFRLSGEGMEKQSICLVRLRELDTTSQSDSASTPHLLLSAEVLRLLVEELSLASAEEEKDDYNVFQENGIRNAFDCTRLTHIISKVIRKFYHTCKEQDIPLFHWLVNVPSGQMKEINDGEDTLACIQMHPSLSLTEAVEVGVRLQDVNLTRSEITETVRGYNRSTKHSTINADEQSGEDDLNDDNSSLSRRRRKLKVKRLYERVGNSRSDDPSRSASDANEKYSVGDDDETREGREELSVPRSVSTAGSYAESWNTVDLGMSAARRRYRLRRKPKRKITVPEVSEAPEEEAGQIPLVDGDFDSTSLRGSSVARSSSTATNSARSTR